jgi:hypothetical protein
MGGGRSAQCECADRVHLATGDYAPQESGERQGELGGDGAHGRPQRLPPLAIPLYSGRPLHHWDLAETIIPMCFARPEDVSIGFQGDIAIEAAGRHHQQSTLHLHARKCRPASRAKAFVVPRRRQREARDPLLPSGPTQSGSRRKQVGSVCRAGVFAAVSAVTEIKPLKISLHLEAHSATQARTRMIASRVHSISSCFSERG